MISYESTPLPFKARQLSPDRHVAVSSSGDHVLLSSSELHNLLYAPERMSLEQQALLRSRFFLTSASTSPGMRRLLQSRVAAKRETVRSGPSLHILVPTLQCAHSCQYCQVSRSLDDTGHAMSFSDINLACDTIASSVARTLTVEFQGGDPLMRFDLIEHAVERITRAMAGSGRRVRYVIASTLHQLTPEMCTALRRLGVYLSTSIDGPAALHNANRPIPTRDSHERTLRGIEIARSELGPDSVSALMTTTRRSLDHPEAIVDHYVELGFREIFLRPLSLYGFARKNRGLLGYGLTEFQRFYARALERVIDWNRRGVEIKEVYASIILNKLLDTFDQGFVDLQSPSGAGLSTLVYNYDGFVYPSDEARMLAEAGDVSLRLGRIGQPLDALLRSDKQREIVRASLTEFAPGCRECPYELFCGPNPVDAQAQFGTMFAPVLLTHHCQRHLWLFDEFLRRIDEADEPMRQLFHRWAGAATL